LNLSPKKPEPSKTAYFNARSPKKYGSEGTYSATPGPALRLLQFGGVTSNDPIIGTNQPDGRQLLSRRKAAALLDVTKKMLSRWERAGRLTAIKPTPRTTRYYRNEIEKAILDAQSVEIPYMSTSNVDYIRNLVGADAVLLPIPRGSKAPKIRNWQRKTLADMADPAYLRSLETGNIGVLQGAPSNGLCSIDIDADEHVAHFFELNPRLTETLQTKGQRGLNLWVRVEDECPKLTPLELDSSEGGETVNWGEWRGTGGHTVIMGKHPSGSNYQTLHEAKPITIRFGEIVWPPNVRLPWPDPHYERIVAKTGEPYFIRRWGIGPLNQMFFTEKFAAENLILHEPDEKQFYCYDESTGLWRPKTVDSLKWRIAQEVKAYADTQQGRIEPFRYNEGFCETLVRLLRGRTEQKGVFMRGNGQVHLANGVIDLKQVPPVLLEFSPVFHSRNRSPIGLDPVAKCPRFLNELLGTALKEQDIRLLQCYCGSLLLGRNLAHAILILTGTAGGGKSTLVEIIERIVGRENVVELRTQLLLERFELARLIGKTLLTGKDVQAEFLMLKGASAIKKLVGHDFLSAEKKNSNACFDLAGEYDVLITCNSRLRVKLEGDADAWRRRLLLIHYNQPKPKRPIPDFAGMLLASEGPGILNWMLQGAQIFLEDLKELGGFRLTDEQKGRVESLLAESDSIRAFIKEWVKPGERSDDVTVEELKLAYVQFCEARNWHAAPPSAVENESPHLIEEIHRVCRCNNVRRDGGCKRGYKNLKLEPTL
jgi:P4 family phage/plasmid primase-like protien